MDGGGASGSKAGPPSAGWARNRAMGQLAGKNRQKEYGCHEQGALHQLARNFSLKKCGRGEVMDGAIG